MTWPVSDALYSGCAGGRCRGEALVGQRQPLPHLAGGFIGRLAVKRHHGRRYTRAAAQLRPPPVADGRHLNLVRAPANGLLEMMNDHVCDVQMGLGAATILRFGAKRSSEAPREGRIHSAKRPGLFAVAREKNFSVRFST